MTKTDRYDVSDLIEAQYQPGSRGRVLRNLLGITGKRMMDEAEAREQKRALQDILSSYSARYRFKAADICGFTRYGSAVFTSGPGNIGALI